MVVISLDDISSPQVFKSNQALKLQKGSPGPVPSSRHSAAGPSVAPLATRPTPLPGISRHPPRTHFPGCAVRRSTLRLRSRSVSDWADARSPRASVASGRTGTLAPAADRRGNATGTGISFRDGTQRVPCPVRGVNRAADGKSTSHFPPNPGRLPSVPNVRYVGSASTRISCKLHEGRRLPTIISGG